MTIMFTQAGYDKLVEQLADFRTRREPTVIRLQQAREMGDLSENGAYKAARFELSDIDRNIRRLEGLIKDAVVATPKGSSKAEFGSMVEVEKDGIKTQYQLVSRFESDPVQKKLSVESPIGQAILGKSKGDKVEIETPNGKVKYKIIKVS